MKIQTMVLSGAAVAISVFAIVQLAPERARTTNAEIHVAHIADTSLDLAMRRTRPSRSRPPCELTDGREDLW